MNAVQLTLETVKLSMLGKVNIACQLDNGHRISVCAPEEGLELAVCRHGVLLCALNMYREKSCLSPFSTGKAGH